jgi:hypothetical protein
VVWELGPFPSSLVPFVKIPQSISRAKQGMCDGFLAAGLVRSLHISTDDALSVGQSSEWQPTIWAVAGRPNGDIITQSGMPPY